MFNLFKLFSISGIFLIIFSFFVLCFTIRFFDISTSAPDVNYPIYSSGFVWPTPNYTQITSPFGYRQSPFTNVLSAFSGTVTYIGFSGANGFTVRISNGDFEATYSHLSPNFIVYVGQMVFIGDVIAIIGPKNVYGIPNNPYKDSNGNPTNGSTTGPHLHFSLKKGR